MFLKSSIVFIGFIACGIITLASTTNPKQSQPHPLDPLTPAEIILTRDTILRDHPGNLFVWITLQEPEKSVLLPYYLSNTEPPVGSIPRRSFSIVLDPTTGSNYEAVVEINSASSATLISWTQLPAELDTMFAGDELALVGEVALADPTVQARVAIYDQPFNNISYVVSDVWKYGYVDKPEYMGRRIAQVFFYGKSYENDNFYVHPMGFAAIVDVLTREVLEIEELPIQSDFSTDNRDGDEVPVENSNYDPSVSGRWYRDDISPITISQEGGPSFKIDGNLLEWQKFKMRVGRNAREGLTLHNVYYNDSGAIRPLMYRASVAELFVPYGDPRPPFHRKMAMDVGEYGMGFSASELRSPDGCRGSVFFYDSVNNDMAGNPSILRNTICIYEEDAGILWRKMDPVTFRVVTARSQRLVLTFIATVSNYDYQFKWIFYQDASIKIEVTLTGIISQNLLGTDATPAGHGTIVMPHINGQFHQHFFVCRFDVEFDGNKNTVSVVDVYADPNPGTATNPYGNGFSFVDTPLRTSSEGRTKTSQETARTWKISGEPTNLNPITGTVRAWKLIPENGPRSLTSPLSPMHPKSAFTDFDVWVTPYKENQLFPAGYYLNNSGLPEWVAEDPNASIENTDIVLWHVFGITHIVRIEDVPVMPCETIGFWLKPANFFTENPGIDVLPITFDSSKGKRQRSEL